MTTADFIQTCERVGEIDLSAPVRERMGRAVTEQMPRQYAIPFPLAIRDTFDRQGPSTRNRRGQWHELVQHLTDLSYLSQENFREWHRQRAADRIPSPALLAAVLAAVGAFVAEDGYPPYALLAPFPPRNSSERLEWVEKHLSVVVHRLSAYVSFDGELDPRPDYTIGERSCYGRSLAFRMRVYFHTFVDRRTTHRKVYFDADLLPLLHSLNASLGGAFTAFLPGAGATTLAPEFQALLLRWHVLFAAFRRANRFLGESGDKYFLAYDLHEAATPPGPDHIAAAGSDDREERRTERLIRRARRRLKRHELHVDTGGNRLGVRLLQLGLWRAGFYTGALDGAFGARSHAAVVALLEQERDRNDWIAAERRRLRDLRRRADPIRGQNRRRGRDRRRGRENDDDDDADRRSLPKPVLKNRQLRKVHLEVPTDDGATLWKIDLRLVADLLDAYVPPPEEEAEREEEAVWDSIRAADAEAQLDANFTERQAEVRDAYGDLHRHPGRRVYFGLRGLIRGAFRAIGRIVNWIVHRIKKILGAVFDFVKAVVKRLQEGISAFFEGFTYFAHYLLGRPFVSVGRPTDGRAPVLSTAFRLDFDSVGLVSAAATGEDMRAHAAYLRRMGEGIEYFLGATVKIITFVRSLQPPLGWLRLGIYIARRVRDLLRGGLRERVAVA